MRPRDALFTRALARFLLALFRRRLQRGEKLVGTITQRIHAEYNCCLCGQLVEGICPLAVHSAQFFGVSSISSSSSSSLTAAVVIPLLSLVSLPSEVFSAACVVSASTALHHALALRVLTISPLPA